MKSEVLFLQTGHDGGKIIEEIDIPHYNEDKKMIKTITIDKFAHMKNITSIDIIKIDFEDSFDFDIITLSLRHCLLYFLSRTQIDVFDVNYLNFYHHIFDVFRKFEVY